MSTNKQHFAVYKKICSHITKDGHTMLTEDVVRDLNRKSFLESEAVKSPWTSVDDLPALNKKHCVDVWAKSYGRIVDCSYCHERGNWYSYHDDLIDDVTHWMEQPNEPEQL